MTAFEKYSEEQARFNSVNWINVLMGDRGIVVDPTPYEVSSETFKKQARKEGFKTKMWNSEEIFIYR